MDYKVVVTEDAEEDLDRFVKYLLFEKRSEQAAVNFNEKSDTDNGIALAICIHSILLQKFCHS